MSFCIVNGERVESAKAVISVQDRGFRFGDGVFSTLPVFNGVPYQFDWHMQRLANGLRDIKIHYDLNKIYQYTRALIKDNAVVNGMVRIEITRGIGSQGYLPDPSHPQAGATIVIETLPLPTMPADPITLWQSSYTKISAKALPTRTKLCQGLNSTLARIEATDEGCSDALQLNDRGQLCETSSANIFWFKSGKLYTPTLASGALDGSTRAAILRLQPYPVVELDATLEVLADAQALVMTNASYGAVAINRLLPNGMRWDSEAVAQHIRQVLADDIAHYTSTHRGEWLVLSTTSIKQG